MQKQMTTKSQIKQRKGRTGRTNTGKCYHLYTKEQYDALEEYPESNIKWENITGEILKLVSMYKTKSEAINILNKFIEPPKLESINFSFDLLENMKFIKNNEITELGKHSIQLHNEPKIALTLLNAINKNCFYWVAAIICMCEATKWNIKALFYARDKQDQQIIKKTMNKFKHNTGDHMSLLNIFNEFRHKKKWKSDNKKNNNSKKCNDMR